MNSFMDKLNNRLVDSLHEILRPVVRTRRSMVGGWKMASGITVGSVSDIVFIEAKVACSTCPIRGITMGDFGRMIIMIRRFTI